MKLEKWLEIEGNTQQKLAKKLSVLGKPITQGAISQWRDKTTGEFFVPDRRVLHIEEATHGLVSRYEMRPDMYPRQAA